MSFPRPRLFGLALVLATAGMLLSCRDKKETLSSDLSEAGYQMTPEDWFRASRENNVEALKKFLSGGFSKDTRDEAGNTALHAAAAAGAEKSADYLLTRGIPIDSAGEKGRTPLMAAVVSDKPAMVRWLLRQGASPLAKDAENFKPLMLAVREGSAGSVMELASYDREDLDPALLLAALMGRTGVIDSLTNYGASVYARMDDGRTPLMLAAQNGHAESVKLLLDIGASRHTTDAGGKTAATLATEAGHPEIAAMINREPTAAEMALETPEEVARGMDEFVAAAEGDSSAETETEALKAPGATGIPATSEVAPEGKPVPRPRAARAPSKPIEGAVLGFTKAPAPDSKPAAARGRMVTVPVIMRHYREADVPVQVAEVSGETATLKINGRTDRQVKVRAGEAIPGSSLVVLRVKRRMEDSKLTDGRPMEVSVVEVSDRNSGAKREWISGRPSTAHDPVALVEDPLTGQRYTAVPGQRFKSADGGEFRVADVRPNQIVIEDLSDGSVQTVPLSGPRG